MKQIKVVIDDVNEFTGKTFAIKHIEYLEYFRYKLWEQDDLMSQLYEKFTIEKHEEIVAATIVYKETIGLIESAMTDIQIIIEQFLRLARAK